MASRSLMEKTPRSADILAQCVQTGCHVRSPRSANDCVDCEDEVIRLSALAARLSEAGRVPGPSPDWVARTRQQLLLLIGG